MFAGRALADQTALARMIAENRCLGLRVRYSLPYYVVEVVPRRWQSLLVPGLAKSAAVNLIRPIERAIEPFFKPLGIRFPDPKDRVASMADGLNYFEVHVYRLGFDIGKMIDDLIKQIADALATGGAVSIHWDKDWLKPDICYLSEVDPLGWRMGVPRTECKRKKVKRCSSLAGVEYDCKWVDECDSVQSRSEDRGRFWEGISQPGMFSWAGLNDRSGWVTHADPKFAAAAMALRGASIGSRRLGSPGGCWLDGRGASEFDPLDPQLLSEGKVAIMLVDTGHKPRPHKPAVTAFQLDTQAVQMPVAPLSGGVGGLGGGPIGTEGGRMGGGSLGGSGLRGGGMRAPARSAPATSGGNVQRAPERSIGEEAKPANIAEIVGSNRSALKGISQGPSTYTAGPQEWNSCIPVGWEAQRWNRDEYWRGNVSEGALFIVYKTNQDRCLIDASDVGRIGAELLASFLQDALTEVITAGGGTAAVVVKYTTVVANTIAQIYDAYEQVKQILDYIQKIEQAIQQMKALLEAFKVLFEQFGTEMAKYAGPTAVNMAVNGLMTYFGVDEDVQKGFYDVQCSMDIGRRVIEGSKALTGLSVCGHGVGDIPGVKTVNAKITSIEQKIPKVLITPPVSTMAEQACTYYPIHDPVKNIQAKVATYETKLKTIQSYLTYGDYACMAVRVVSNPPKDAEGLIKLFGDPKLNANSPVLSAVNTLQSLRHPDQALDAAIAQVRSMSGITQSEVTWWQGKADSVRTELNTVNFSPSRVKDIPDRLKRLAGPDLVKDLAAPIENDAKKLLSSGLKISSKMFDDFEALAKRGEGLIRKMEGLTILAKLDSPEKAVEAIVVFASLKVEFELWVGDMQRLLKNMPQYQTELTQAATALQNTIGQLPGRIRNLDRDLADQVYGAVFVDPAPLHRASGHLRDMATRAGTLPGGAPQLASGLGAAADGLKAAADGMSVISKQTLYDLLSPVHDVLVTAGDALESLTKGVGNAQTGMLAELGNLSQGLGDMGGDLELFKSEATGPAFHGDAPSGNDLWALLGNIEAYARMKEGGVTRPAWATAVAETTGKGSAETVGRFVRNAVPLRQEEIDAAGGDDNAAKDALEKKAKEEHEKMIETARDPKKYGLLDLEDYRKERAKSGSPVNKAWQDAVNACKEKAREKKQKAPQEGWDESMCDRRW